MKNKILILTGLLFAATGGGLSARADVNKGQQDGAITVASSPDLSLVAEKWSKEYNNTKPAVQVALSAYSPAAMEDAEISFVTSDNYQSMKAKPEWLMVVGRDAVVPVINGLNPLSLLISEKGIMKEKLASAFREPGSKNWNTLTDQEQSLTLNIYLPNDSRVAERVASFLGIEAKSMNYIPVGTASEVITAVQKDANGIGFTRMISLVNASQQAFPDNLRLMAIDKNGNGKMDYFEKIYDNWPDFLRGVWLGKYPHALCSELYAVAAVQPDSKASIDFLSWVLTSGQSYLNDYGYLSLVGGDRQRELDKLTVAGEPVAPARNYSLVGILLMSVVLLVVVGLGVTWLLSYLHSRKRAAAGAAYIASEALDENSVKSLAGVYFDRSHTWSFMEKDGLVRVGIDDFLQHVTGPITCVKMKKAGEKVTRGETFLSLIQEGKRLNIKSPVSGTVKEHNEVLILNSALVNASPYNDGWIYTLEPSNWIKEIQALFLGERYKTWIQQEMIRLKDFLATSMREHKLELSAVTLQDGGPLHDNVLAGLGPEVWDDFQTNFLDTAL